MAHPQTGGAGEKLMEDINSLPESKRNIKNMAENMQKAFQAFNDYGKVLNENPLTKEQLDTSYTKLIDILNALLDLSEPEAPKKEGDTAPDSGCRKVDSFKDIMGDPEDVAKGLWATLLEEH